MEGEEPRGPRGTMKSLLSTFFKERSSSKDKSKKRRDLFGFIDILAIKDADVIAIQATTRSHVSDRVKKIENSKYVDAVRKCAWSIEVWGWYQTKDGDWKVRIVDCS